MFIMDILHIAEEFVFQLFKANLPDSYIYHNFDHTQKVILGAKAIAESEKINEHDLEILLIAAWFHDTGYVHGFLNHEAQSAQIVSDFLKNQNKDKEFINKTIALIHSTRVDYVPESLLEMIIKDADYWHFGSKDYLEICQLLREEWRLTQNKHFTDLEWATENRRILLHCHRYFTNYAKENWLEMKSKNVFKVQELIQKLNAGTSEFTKAKIKEKKIEKLERPERGIETMFRTTLSNHTRLSDIADSKANILLSVNAIIISISLSTLIPKLDSPSNAHLIIPTFVLLIFSVFSIICAILSTRPKVTSGVFTRKDIEDKKVNLLFFGNFHKMPLQEYEWAVNEMMKDRDYLYNSMIKDLYYLGLVLNRKYKILRVTYLVFMLGIICSVIAFVNAFLNSGY